MKLLDDESCRIAEKYFSSSNTTICIPEPIRLLLLKGLNVHLNIIVTLCHYESMYQYKISKSFCCSNILK